mmetsp:Transcript_14555/g.37171  ORF Transcript_14555/g.37171 Transcript_14555/m.37171 type:complete len:265 (-) Transcript_14555:218-1012(-)
MSSGRRFIARQSPTSKANYKMRKHPPKLLSARTKPPRSSERRFPVRKSSTSKLNKKSARRHPRKLPSAQLRPPIGHKPPLQTSCCNKTFFLGPRSVQPPPKQLEPLPSNLRPPKHRPHILPPLPLLSKLLLLRPLPGHLIPHKLLSCHQRPHLLPPRLLLRPLRPHPPPFKVLWRPLLPHLLPSLFQVTPRPHGPPAQKPSARSRPYCVRFAQGTRIRRFRWGARRLRVLWRRPSKKGCGRRRRMSGIEGAYGKRMAGGFYLCS